jgi:uncharacterized protein (DUF488 family)
MDSQAKITVFTIGHSTRAVEDFIMLLKEHGIEKVIDIRTIPRSRHNPQYNADTLPQTLRQAGLGYEHLAGLGGLRKARPDSPNGGWRNASFRGFADYMQTEAFQAALGELTGLAERERVVIMCAEAVPWRCHRSLIGDALAVRGFDVRDIIGPGSMRPHTITRWARVSGTRITYPAEPLPESGGA